MICYFWEGLKPSIKVEIEQQNQALTSFEEMVQRAVNAEAKAGLKSSIMVQNADSCCLRDHCLSQYTFTKVQTPGSTAKKSKPKESQPKDLKLTNGKILAPPHTNKPGKTFCQNKKKGYLKKKRDWKNSILAIRNNAIKGEKKWNNWGRTLVSKPAPEILLLCQPEEMSFLSGWNLFSGVHSVI